MSIKQSSRLLIDEPALQVLPSLAVAVGLNEAIVLQQVHYWLKNAEANRRLDNYQDSRWWVYNSYPEWKRDAFPWWSEDTIQRTFKSLEKKGMLITGKLSNNPYDQRKWYSIDYDALDQLNLRSSITATCVDALPQNAPMDDSKMRSSHHRKMRSSITENKTPTETTSREAEAASAPPPPVEDTSIQKPEPTQAIQETTRKEPTPQQALVAALSEATGMDTRLNGSRLGKAAAQLARVEATPDLIRQHYGPGGWWYTSDWRGQKGEFPRPEQVIETWGQWTRAAPVANGKPPGKGRTSEAWRQVGESPTLMDLRRERERKAEEERRRQYGIK